MPTLTRARKSRSRRPSEPTGRGASPRARFADTKDPLAGEKTKKIQIEVTTPAYDYVKELGAALGNDSVPETFKLGVRVLGYLRDKRMDGFEVLLQKGDRTIALEMFAPSIFQ